MRAPAGSTGWLVRVSGTVQGVGFRPYVHRIATGLGLDGRVRNVGGDVLIEVTAAPAAVTELVRVLRDRPPPHAVVGEVTVRELPSLPPRPGFTVEVSDSGAGTAERGFAGLPADLATCDDCLRELFDPADRRYRYPFLNCTACGPRATIIDALPYDRARTAMAGFPLCPACAREYHDPADRRFHAEPIACPDCGPRLAWSSGPAREQGEEALAAAVTALTHGRIVALKGLGGYQLVCDATDPAAVGALRRRKHRPRKPLAVMVADVAGAARLARLGRADTELLTSPARPIVLVPALATGGLADAVHPGTARTGVFLPSTPLHHLLLRAVAGPLVVTSGNLSGEPIAVDDEQARRSLAPVADGMLWHDRPIRARYDDSVVRVAGGARRTLRRARGYAPSAVPLPVPAPRPVLAVGAQLKHTFALARGGLALIGPHGGDLGDADALAAFTAAREQLCRLHRFTPELVAHDRHPGYLSTAYAVEAVPAERRIAVQHHHAHVAACAAENGVEPPFLGVAYDGLGWGDDGTFWGGELLLATYTGYRRLGRFGHAPMPGGAAAVRRPARMALGYLYGGEFAVTGVRPAAALPGTGAEERRVVRRMVERRLNCPQASSAGRLFDAAAALLGLCDDASYEGEAAVLLEAAATTAGSGTPLPWRLRTAGGLCVYDWGVTLAALAGAYAAGEPVAALAAGFHRTVVDVTTRMCVRAAERTGVSVVCLSGGCLQNGILAAELPAALEAAGLGARLGGEVPAGDGGISYGQAVVAAATTAAKG
ncbi:carbamoyltransferase HypF [Actinoplanes sp. NBRC 14428]|uniref:Carbamoyltransferase n=1 Tax=Pseudosporangium ferrugineum TaxID=439699 RepID=A0A2T0RKE6_9ACTN|nr:carbamoyltransferase HypF [Pseudosporangium ferrugineum]PRY21611.1 hydrogenase maturation protein HypF [Pseudosporangium ferrugineum]BCJ49313.1 carbamoyltransferase HypF [Actinoplanes sp. NBRC 14428]